MESDRLSNDSPGVDCIMLTLDAERHLVETLDAVYREVPVRRLLVIDGGSKDNTVRLLMQYPRVTIQIRKGMTTGKSLELLFRMVDTPWCVFVDVGKILDPGWWVLMQQGMDQGEFLGSLRYNLIDGKRVVDQTIQDSSRRPLGGPWAFRTSFIRDYHVDDDYVQRCTDIVLRRSVDEKGGRYHLVSQASHVCYPPNQEIPQDVLRQRHIQIARGIVKYITPEYARQHAPYLLGNHWMMLLHNLHDDEWIQKINPGWLQVLRRWRMYHLWYAKPLQHIYGLVHQ